MSKDGARTKDLADAELGGPQTTSRNTESGASGPAKKILATPKFVFAITSPCLVTVSSTDARQAMKDFIDKSFASPPASSTKLKIKMHSLIIKMVNNLIQQELVAFEAVQILSSAGNIDVRILLPPSALPIVMDRCERIGVGSVVGNCHAVPLETSMLPDPGPPQKLTLAPGGSGVSDAATGASETATVGATSFDCRTSKTSAITGECCTRDAAGGEDDSGHSISSEEDNDEDNDKVSTNLIPESLQVPFLGPERKKELQKRIAAAREEWKNTASRVRVEQVVEEVAAGAAFTLDYLAFVICASIIAAVGLATDSSVSVIASMLVSPIMGPVLGFTFGTTIRRRSLILTGLRNEAISLVICIVVGMVMCILAAVSHTYERRGWPSEQMITRGDITGLVSGILVALPSGMAVALSTLGKNSSGLTGVAISLSLLPPAVNAGLCWMYELLLLSDWVGRNQGDDTVYWETGLISFGLTMINIVCIWIGGVFMFWLKEVAPVRKKNAFWSRDVKVAREDVPLYVDTEKIEAGLEAVIELQEAAPLQPSILGDIPSSPNAHLTSAQVGAARRKGLADNAMEDAFFFAVDFGLDGEIVGGGAVCNGLPDHTDLRVQHAAKRRDSSTKLLFETANKFGGLQGAGEALFDPKFSSNPFYKDDSTSPLIPHEVVAEQILVQDRLDTKKIS